MAAAEHDWGSVARGGGIQRGVEWGQEVAGGAACGGGAAGGGLRPSSVAGGVALRRRQRKQRGREVEDEGWTFLQLQKSSGTGVKNKISH